MKVSNRLVILLSVVTLLAFAGLIPLGRWHDEYFTLYHYHVSGSDYLLERLLHWSPRPFSDALAYLYGIVVYRFGSPFIAEFLALFWLALVATALLPTLRSSKAFLCASALLALFLVGHPVAEVFYWPFGTVAYLPTLAAITLLLTLDWGNWVDKPSGDIWIVAALTVAAASSEVGAVFTAIYVLLLISSRSIERTWRSLIFIIPLLVSTAVLYAQFTGRVAAANEVFGDASVAHHPGATILALSKHLVFELLKGDNGRHGFTMLISGIATKLFFLVGVYLIMSARQDHAPRSQRLRLILVVASIATAALTMAAALYNFGSVCCERHATMRQEYVFIAIGSLATYMAGRWPRNDNRHSGLLLLFSMLIPLSAAIPKLKVEYQGYAQTRLAGIETWQSGHSAGPAMQITQTMPGPITGGLYIEPGFYRSGSLSKNDVPWMLVFFGKQSATASAPSGSPDKVYTL